MDGHRRRLRPWRIAYGVAILIVIVCSVVAVAIAYDHGEISHVTLRTAIAPRPIALQPTSPSPQPAWSSSDHPASGRPLWGGTVVSYDEHTVRGRDALTGDPTWAYTRTDRTVCGAVQDQGVTVAVFRLGDRCDELTALDSQTGTREWTRTLFEDGAPFAGTATYSVVPGAVMFVSRTSIYTIATTSADGVAPGIDLWKFHHDGCAIQGATIGESGALISQTCRKEQCTGVKFCADGNQLLAPIRDRRIRRQRFEPSQPRPHRVERHRLDSSARVGRTRGRRDRRRPAAACPSLGDHRQGHRNPIAGDRCSNRVVERRLREQR